MSSPRAAAFGKTIITLMAVALGLFALVRAQIEMREVTPGRRRLEEVLGDVAR